MQARVLCGNGVPLLTVALLALAATAPAVRAQPAGPELVVDAGGAGDFRTIGEAIAAAPDGATLRIRPGTYRESLTLERPLHLVGDGVDPRAVNLVATGGPCLTSSARGASLRGLSLVYRGFDVVDCLLIEGGDLRVEDSIVASRSGSAVAVRGAGTAPTLRGNLIREARDAGILVFEGAGGTYADNEITGSELAGIAVTSRGDPEVTGNRIHDNPGAGIEVFQGGRGTFTDNEIADNAQSGVKVKERGAPRLRDNRITGNGEAGIWIYNDGSGRYEANTVSGNRLEGIDVSSGDPVLTGNRIHDNGKADLVIRPEARCTCTDNVAGG